MRIGVGKRVGASDGDEEEERRVGASDEEGRRVGAIDDAPMDVIFMQWSVSGTMGEKKNMWRVKFQSIATCL